MHSIIVHRRNFVDPHDPNVHMENTDNIIRVFDALVTHYWWVGSRRPACHQHIDDWRDDVTQLCMKWIALGWLGPAQSLAEHCRWLVSVLISWRWHGMSESGQTSRMKTNPLQTVVHRNADQEWWAVWSGRLYQLPNLNPVGQNLDATMRSTTLKMKEKSEIGLQDIRWSKSKVPFFSRASTSACFWVAGKTTQLHVPQQVA